jgi:hypothetical protein
MGRLLTLAWVLSGCGITLDLGSNDAGVPYDADCRPGTYAGSYSCTTKPGSLLQGVSNNGPITVTLVPAGPGSLALTPDASLSSASSGTASNSSLSGVLDCSKRKLTGMVGEVVISSATFNGTILGSGAFDAVYDADASPPALVGGLLVPPPILAATCTWTATLE